jgi:hypothetical protein
MSEPTRLLEFFEVCADSDTPEMAEERNAVRVFLQEARARRLFTPNCDNWLSGHSPTFSRELGQRGWIGMTWPAAYGGRDAGPLSRLAVIEELLAQGAPVAAHWFADRQVGPSLLKYGTIHQRRFFLPAMARGELFFCVGMSEPESGSDLGSVRTRAYRYEDKWHVSGVKIWTSHADKADYILALVRTGSIDQRPAEALTQVLIDMSAPGVSVRPITMLDGQCHFCEVTFDDVSVTDDMVLGTVGDGWKQVLGELAFERSGPERFLSTFPIVPPLARAMTESDTRRDAELGALAARLSVLRAMSARINQCLNESNLPTVPAAIAKDLGTTLENDTIDVTRGWIHALDDPQERAAMLRMFSEAQAHAPAFTLRGGTSEILRGIVARALGVS